MSIYRIVREADKYWVEYASKSGQKFEIIEKVINSGSVIPIFYKSEELAKNALGDHLRYLSEKKQGVESLNYEVVYTISITDL